MKSNNPWLALSTYEEEDEYRLKGRDKDKENVLTMLQQDEYITIYAASGDGKSSLINAGLCPEMRRQGYFPIKITMPEIPNAYVGDNGIIDFDTLVFDQIYQSLRLREKYLQEKYGKEDYHILFEKIEDYTGDSILDRKLWWKLRTESIQIPYGEFDYTPVLIFDQFEELFRTQYKYGFFKWLEQLTKDICPDHIRSVAQEKNITIPTTKRYKILFSMRYEYVGELDYYCSQRCYIPQMMRGRYFLKPLNKEQAISVITEQTEGDNDALKTIKENADRIISGLSKHNSISQTNIINENRADAIIKNSNCNDNEISAILLSILCYVYYNNIVTDGIKELPETKNLISKFYINKLEELNISEADISEIENKLLTKEGTRKRSVCIDDIQALKKKIKLKRNPSNETIKEEIWKILKDEHLLYAEDKGSKIYVEYAHDKLADAANDQRALRVKRKKADYVKLFIGILGICLLFGAFINVCYTPQCIYDQVTAGKVDRYAEYQVVNADSGGYLSDIAVKRIRLESKKGKIAFSFGANLPYLEEIELCDTLKNNGYSFEDGILWYNKKDSTFSEILFVAKNASRIYEGKRDSFNCSSQTIYSKYYLETNRESIVATGLILLNDSILVSVDEKVKLLDTLDLSNYENIKSIGTKVFDNCNFRAVILPRKLNRLSSYTFKNCHYLKNVVFNNDSCYIPHYCFYRCDSVNNIVLPKNSYIGFPELEDLGTSSPVFYDCQSLHRIYSGKYLRSVNFAQSDSVLNILCDGQSKLINDVPLTSCFIAGVDNEPLVRFKTENNKLFVKVFSQSGRKHSFISVSAETYQSQRDLTDIYLLSLSNNVHIKFNNLDSIDCSHITLHVPYNTLQYMKYFYRYYNFLDIQEMSLVENSYYVFLDYMDGALQWIKYNQVITIVSIILVVLLCLLFYKSTNKIVGKIRARAKSKFVKQLASSCLLFFVFFLATYWFVYLEYGNNQLNSCLYGGVVGLIIVALSLRSDWLQDNFIRLYKDTKRKIKNEIRKHKYLLTPVLLLFTAAVYFSFSYSNFLESINKQLEEVIGSRDLKTAAAIMNDATFAPDTSIIPDGYVLRTPIAAIKYNENTHYSGAVLDKDGRFLYTFSSNDSVLTKWDVDRNEMVKKKKQPFQNAYLNYSKTNNSLILISERDSIFSELNTELETINATKVCEDRNSFCLSDDAKYFLSFNKNVVTLTGNGMKKKIVFPSLVNRVKWIDNLTFGVFTVDDSLHIVDKDKSKEIASHLASKWDGDVQFSAYGIYVHKSDSIYRITPNKIVGKKKQIGWGNINSVGKYIVRNKLDSIFVYDEELNILSKTNHRYGYGNLSSPIGNRFVLVFGNYIVVYDAKTCKEVFNIRNTVVTQTVKRSPYSIASLTEDGRVLYADFTKSKISENNILSDICPYLLTYGKKGIYAGYNGKTAYYPDKGTVECFNTGVSYDGNYFLKESPDGESFASYNSTQSRKLIYIWNKVNNQIVDSIILPDKIKDLAYDKKGKSIAVLTSDSTYIYDIQTKKNRKLSGMARFDSKNNLLLHRNDSLYYVSGKEIFYLGYSTYDRFCINEYSHWLAGFTWNRCSLYKFENNKLNEILPFSTEDDEYIRELLFLSETNYCIRTDKTLYLYTTEKKNFIKNYHLTKEQREKYGIPWWIYYTKLVLSYLGIC